MLGESPTPGEWKTVYLSDFTSIFLFDLEVETLCEHDRLIVLGSHGSLERR